MCNRAVKVLVSKSRKRPCVPFGGLQLFADGGDGGTDGDDDDLDDDRNSSDFAGYMDEINAYLSSVNGTAGKGGFRFL